MKVPLKIRIPQVPNFITIEGGQVDTCVSIDKLDDKTLRKIGKEWTAKLLERAKIRRDNDQKRGF